MRPSELSIDHITALLHRQTIATMPELMAALGTHAKRTVFRKRSKLAYRSSYSHRGCYYTLDELAHFDERGLWSCRDVWFSSHGTLLATSAAMVEASAAGYFVAELDNVLHVGSKDVLRKLVADARLAREKLTGQLLYCATAPGRKAQQLLARRTILAEPGLAKAFPDAALVPAELSAAVVLFVSLLDEQQRRLYAGLESLKSGRGGDRRIAELIGLDMGTIARGRRELLAQDIAVDRVRRAGGGRPAVEKKRRTSSPKSRR